MIETRTRALKERVQLMSCMMRWRVIRGKSQQELCRETGSAQAQISRIESGRAGVTLGLAIDMGKAIECELVVVPLELKKHIVQMVDRYAQQCELDIEKRGPVGRPRGSLNKPPMPAGRQRSMSGSFAAF
jgi:DNA-binding XRE family transcriptional regulator